jgi:putative ABC transport system substrate-binding protein
LPVAHLHELTKHVEDAARAIGLKVLALDAAGPDDIAPAFATLAREHADALLMGASAALNAGRSQIIVQAAHLSIPVMFFYSAAVSEGGFSSYGPDIKQSPYQIGIYTGRILRGEKPADLAVMQSTKFEFVINLKTAKALGLELSPMLLAVADEVIE